MNTPIYNFVQDYASSAPVRLHMPGHKGRGPLGCEEWDITEIPGADSLYEANGIIAESERNASQLFGCPTFYSTEGSSHCIRAMLLLACKARQGIKNPECRDEHRSSADKHCLSLQKETGSFRVLAARNCHKAFLSAAALLDLDVVWLPTSGGSYLSAQPTPEGLDAALTESGAEAVYLTCPDYLGFLPDLGPLAEVCHAHGALLLVDNAHGAYLRFLTPSRHPMDLGADLCCDSAHKTLPVLTGGAYLHVAERLLTAWSGRDGALPSAPPQAKDAGERSLEPLAVRTAESRPYRAEEAGREPRPLRAETVKDALALFGSTSPSYLILQSLDLANPYLEKLPEQLADFLPKVEALKSRLRAAGWTVVGDEPMKLTLSLAAVEKTSPACRGWGPAARPVEGFRPAPCFPSGTALAAALERAGIYCEFYDADHLVCMLTPENTEEDLHCLEAALSGVIAAADGKLRTSDACPCIPLENAAADEPPAACPAPSSYWLPERVCSIREAMLAPAEAVPAAESLGRVLARPGVSCPPAVPILMPGERIDEAAVAAFERYGIQTVSVL